VVLATKIVVAPGATGSRSVVCTIFCCPPLAAAGLGGGAGAGKPTGPCGIRGALVGAPVSAGVFVIGGFEGAGAGAGAALAFAM